MLPRALEFVGKGMGQRLLSRGLHGHKITELLTKALEKPRGAANKASNTVTKLGNVGGIQLLASVGRMVSDSLELTLL